jgi:hypothetical protein
MHFYGVSVDRIYAVVSSAFPSYEKIKNLPIKILLWSGAHTHPLLFCAAEQRPTLPLSTDLEEEEPHLCGTVEVKIPRRLDRQAFTSTQPMSAFHFVW